MKKRNTFLQLITVIILTLGITAAAACSNNGSGEKWWSTTGEITKDGDGNVVYSNVELILETVSTGDDYAAIEGIVNDFNEEYNGRIMVKLVGTAEEGYAKKVMQNIQNQINAPDLLMAHQKLGQTFVDSKIIQPFDEAFEAAEINFEKSNFAQNLAELSAIGTGYQYGIPIDAQGEIIIYNKVLLDELGMEVPADRDELLAVCAAAEVKWGSSIIPMGIGTDSPFFNKYVWPTALLQNGVELYNPQDYTADWAGESNLSAIKDATRAIDEFFVNGYSVYGRSISYVNQQFQQGNMLFCMNVPISVPGIIKAYASNQGITQALARQQVGAMSISKMLAIDTQTDDAGIVYGDSHFFMFSKTVRDITKKAAAAAFVDWFTNNASGGAKWAEAGHITASKVISESEIYNNNSYVTGFINKFFPDLSNFRTFGNNPYFSDYDTILNKLCGELLKERQSYLNNEQFKSIVQANTNEINGLVTFEY